jgi:hypothetical protein
MTKLDGWRWFHSGDGLSECRKEDVMENRENMRGSLRYPGREKQEFGRVSTAVDRKISELDEVRDEATWELPYRASATVLAAAALSPLSGEGQSQNADRSRPATGHGQRTLRALVGIGRDTAITTSLVLSTVVLSVLVMDIAFWIFG